MSAPNARTVIAEFLHLYYDESGLDPEAYRPIAEQLVELLAGLAESRYVVIDTEGADGDGTVWGLDYEPDPFEWYPGMHLADYRLTQPGDGG